MLLAKITSISCDCNNIKIGIYCEMGWHSYLHPIENSRKQELLKFMRVTSLNAMIGELIWVYGDNEETAFKSTGISLLRLNGNFSGLFKLKHK